MKTEDDTFNALRRRPFREVLISILDPMSLGQDIVPADRHPAIVNAGWNVGDFMAILFKEIGAGKSLGDISVMGSEKWREEYLRTGPI